MPTIAVIEDDDGIRDFVARGLTGSGLDVRTARDGDRGLELALQEDIDLVVLDLMLPALPGVEILRQLYERRPFIPVIVLTALAEVDDRVEGLRAGAVDYVVKPFSFAELEARVQAQLRAAVQAPTTALSHGRLSIDLLSRRVTDEDHLIRLTKTEFELLVYLVQNAGTALTRSQLRAAVWGHSDDFETNIVDVYVGYLRRKLVGPDGPLVTITAIRSRGYRLERQVDLRA
jgi:DNA-binding response OmpR family regulator